MQVNFQKSYTSIQAIFAMAQDFYAEGRGAPYRCYAEFPTGELIINN